MNRKTFKEPLKYSIGTDIPEKDYQELLLKLADWFSESRKTTEPSLLAKHLMQECLDGLKQDGTPWFGAASASLASRVRIKCQYDIEKMEPIRKASEKQKHKKSQEKIRKELKRARDRNDPLLPDEIRKELQINVRYGDDAAIYFTQKEHQVWEELKEAYVQQFPELGTVNAQAELTMLCDLHIQWERMRMSQNKGNKVNPELLQGVTKQMAELKKMLGIHPDQQKNKLKNKEDLTIGAAVAKLEAVGWRELRERFWIEEIIQMWMMYHTPKADGNGYQLDDVGLYGLTKSKVTDCPKCGTKQFYGLDIKDIAEYLERKGYIVPLTPEEQEYIEQQKAIQTPQGAIVEYTEEADSDRDPEESP